MAVRRPRLLVIDPSIVWPEDEGVAEIVGDWPGSSQVLRPALRPGDGPAPGDPVDASKNFYILSETNTNSVFLAIESIHPTIVIIDSIQTLYSSQLDSAAGSIGQVRQCAGELMKYAKETNTPVFLIGHITKDGLLAGPKVLEHMVDTVLQFEGDRHLAYRILRTTKNRFGSTSEIGIYEMIGTGLREVSNPSEILISQKEGQISGVTIGATIEGNRPLLIEIQSLAGSRNSWLPEWPGDTRRCLSASRRLR